MTNTWTNPEDACQADAGELIAAGDLVTIHADGEAYVANAGAGADQDLPVAGIAEASCASGERVEIKRDGKVAGATGLTPGQWIYLATSDGEITQTAPADAGDAVQIVGYAVSQTEWMIHLAVETLVS